MRIENVVKEDTKCMETKRLDNQLNKKRNNPGNNRYLLIRGGFK